MRRCPCCSTGKIVAVPLDAVTLMSSQAILIEASRRGYWIDKAGALFNPRGKAVKGVIDCDGYINTGFRWGDTRSAKLFFHRLQAYQKYSDHMFVAGMMVRHLNGNPSDNNWDNIAIGTNADNSMDKDPETRVRSARIAAAKQRKLSDADIGNLILDRKNGMTYAEIIEKYGIAKSTVSYIVNRKTYSDLDIPG